MTANLKCRDQNGIFAFYSLGPSSLSISILIFGSRVIYVIRRLGFLPQLELGFSFPIKKNYCTPFGEDFGEWKLLLVFGLVLTPANPRCRILVVYLCMVLTSRFLSFIFISFDFIIQLFWFVLCLRSFLSWWPVQKRNIWDS